MTNQRKIQWHPAFCSAMELTLMENADSLEYLREFNLSSKPLQVDLVIRKETDEPIKDEIGHIFRRYNLLEYKSPGDELNIDTYYKVVAYGCLYKAMTGSHIDEVKAEDITITLMRQEKPEQLFQSLAASGIEVRRYRPGIYYLGGNTTFATQVIATRELPAGSYIWLKALTRNINRAEATDFVSAVETASQVSAERQLADSVLQVAMTANYDLFESLKKEDPIMCDALRELMKPEIDEALKDAMTEGRKKGRKEGVDQTSYSVAERMIRAKKLSDQEIADYSGLSIEQVRTLRQQIDEPVAV